jgi:hypothetical protein
MFATDNTLLEKARMVLSERSGLIWLIGGSGSGKSTISRAIAARMGVAVYDMDDHVFGRYRFDRQRHPATTAWFSAENPLGWMLSLSWEVFDALYRAASAEYLDLLADDLTGRPDEPLLIDGGITHPSVLTRVIPVDRLICLERNEEARAREWETAANRAEMRASVLALLDGEAMWRRFLEYDRRMTATIGRESRECGVRVLKWDESIDVAQLAETIERSVRAQSLDVEAFLAEARRSRELTTEYVITDEALTAAKEEGRP